MSSSLVWDIYTWCGSMVKPKEVIGYVTSTCLVWDIYDVCLFLKAYLLVLSMWCLFMVRPKRKIGCHKFDLNEWKDKYILDVWHLHDSWIGNGSDWFNKSNRFEFGRECRNYFFPSRVHYVKLFDILIKYILSNAH